MRKNQILKIKYQKGNLYFLFLLVNSLLCIMLGCGKKSPIGYDLIKNRAGEIKLATGNATYSIPLPDSFCPMGSALYLFAGKEGDFEAKSFICFKTGTDTLVTPESLWMKGNDSGKIYVYKVLDSLSTDSLIWSNAPGQNSLILLDSIDILPDSTHSVCIENYGMDTVFYIAICGTGDNMVSINSYRTTKTDLQISIKEDSTTTKVTASGATYIDTSYFQNTSSDSLPIIQTGAYVSKCSLYLNINLTDTDTVCITSLNDSLRTAYKLDSAVVNKAVFTIWVDTINSYEYKNKLINVLYNGKTASAYPTGDSVVFSISSIIDSWFKEGNDLSLLFSGTSSEISRVAFKAKTAKLDITYTLPIKSRKE